MPFGKHKGEPIEDLPSDYIEWALRELDSLRPALKEEMENQLTMRGGHGVNRGKVRR
jgi:exodeoxyribonuclease X